MSNVTITSEEKNGSRYSVKVSDIEAVREHIEWPLGITHDNVILCGNKRERAQLDQILWEVNEAAAPAPEQSAATPASVKKQRYVELLSVAERKSLSHGKAWLCSGYAVDRDSLPPHFEGELICYVYPE